MTEPFKVLCEILREANVRVSFSPNCHSGIAQYVSPGHTCGCWRCRRERGEPWDDNTETQAARDSALARKSLRESVSKARGNIDGSGTP